MLCIMGIIIWPLYDIMYSPIFIFLGGDDVISLKEKNPHGRGVWVLSYMCNVTMGLQQLLVTTNKVSTIANYF